MSGCTAAVGLDPSERGTAHFNTVLLVVKYSQSVLVFGHDPGSALRSYVC